MKKYITILFVATLFGCSNPITDTFKVDSQNYFKPLKKLEMNVVIQQRHDKAKLEEIANYIKTQNTECEILMIFFYTSDLEIGKGAYAVATFNPDLKVDIQRASNEEDKAMKSASIDNANMLGKWIDNTLSMERTILIYSINDTLKMRSIYKDKSFGDKLITKVQADNQTRFNLNDNAEEWYILEENGNLSTHGVNGKYNEMEVLK